MRESHRATMCVHLIVFLYQVQVLLSSTPACGAFPLDKNESLATYQENSLGMLPENETLQDHFRRAFLEGENHDLIIKVGEREFQVHRDILRARSPVFNAMLSYETDERASGIVNIPDCDPSIMELFLLYVYCGEIEDRNETNMIHLYYLADKYDMADLKNVCHNFINRSLSNTNFFEIIELAMFHNDSNLLDYAAEHFINNSQAIVKTEQWQFLRENNRALTDDLLMKYFARIGPLGYEDPLSLYMQTFHYQV